ncbi:hypothetical protein EVAR_52963_1 [Eumeta japonica]|uniref:Uncharacterized protein n=1 Tax=Eumeta variegata TaxID=151549 RepID=A0A4C1Z048_EUMVA|nr:hypothetical protein EVAR_52963_1 [Eumeta japonica]
MGPEPKGDRDRNRQRNKCSLVVQNSTRVIYITERTVTRGRIIGILNVEHQETVRRITVRPTNLNNSAHETARPRRLPEIGALYLNGVMAGPLDLSRRRVGHPGEPRPSPIGPAT